MLPPTRNGGGMGYPQKLLKQKGRRQGRVKVPTGNNGPWGTQLRLGGGTFGAEAAVVEDEANGDGDDGAGDEFEFEEKFVGGVAGRDEGKNDAAEDHEEAEAAGEPDAELAARNEDGVRIGGAVGTAGEFDDRAVHVKERNEVEDGGRVDEDLIGADGSVVDLADEQDDGGNCGLDQDGDVRRRHLG